MLFSVKNGCLFFFSSRHPKHNAPFLLHRYIRKTSGEHRNLSYLRDFSKLRHFNHQFSLQHLRFCTILEVCGFCTCASCVRVHGTGDSLSPHDTHTQPHDTGQKPKDQRGLQRRSHHTSFVRLSICVPSHCLQGTLINICGLHERPNPPS